MSRVHGTPGLAAGGFCLIAHRHHQASVLWTSICPSDCRGGTTEAICPTPHRDGGLTIDWAAIRVSTLHTVTCYHRLMIREEAR